VFIGSEDNAVKPAFKAMEELRDHLANHGTSHGQPWSMGAVSMLEKHKKIPREIGFIHPTIPTTGFSVRAGKQAAGNADWIPDRDELGFNRGEVRTSIQPKYCA